METLMSVFILPITILNLLGGIVAGIWLIILGKFTLVLYAIILTVISTWILALVLAPGLLLAVPLSMSVEKKKYILAYILGSLASLWTYLVMTAWCVLSFLFIINNHDTGSVWPYLLLGYSVATGPWGYMASKEGPDATGSTLGVFFCCLGGIIMMLVTLFSHNITILKLILSFGTVMIIAWIIQIILLISIVKVNKTIEKQID